MLQGGSRDLLKMIQTETTLFQAETTVIILTMLLAKPENLQ